MDVNIGSLSVYKLPSGGYCIIIINNKSHINNKGPIYNILSRSLCASPPIVKKKKKKKIPKGTHVISRTNYTNRNHERKKLHIRPCLKIKEDIRQTLNSTTVKPHED